MSRYRFFASCVVLCGPICLAPALAWAGGNAPAAAAQSASHDGQHDFDFNLGVWHSHIKRITDPFSKDAPSIELDGTVTVRKVWDGRAFLEEIEADGPNGHWQGLTLFLYSTQARQWSQVFANSRL